MSDQLKFFTFYENWRDLADGRDTDEKRLVFYDTIMKYAFDGIVPPRPVKGVSKGVEWAAWDAYNAVRPVIDVCRAKAEAGRKGGSKSGDSKARYGNSNASHKTQAKTQAETQAETQAKTQAETQAENASKNASRKRKQTQAETQAPFINKNNNKNNKENISGSATPVFSFEEDGFDAFWEKYPASCPRKVDKKKCKAKWELIFRDAKPDDRKGLFSSIMQGLDRWIVSSTWSSDGGKYIRAPLVWLNGNCWEDYPDSSGAAPQTNEKPPRKPSAGDWGLCMERCANCAQNACTKGRSVPPPMWSVPSIPQDCPDYSPAPSHEVPSVETGNKIRTTQDRLL